MQFLSYFCHHPQPDGRLPHQTAHHCNRRALETLRSASTSGDSCIISNDAGPSADCCLFQDCGMNSCPEKTLRVRLSREHRLTSVLVHALELSVRIVRLPRHPLELKSPFVFFPRTSNRHRCLHYTPSVPPYMNTTYSVSVPH